MFRGHKLKERVRAMAIRPQHIQSIVFINNIDGFNNEIRRTSQSVCSGWTDVSKFNMRAEKERAREKESEICRDAHLSH